MFENVCSLVDTSGDATGRPLWPGVDCNNIRPMLADYASSLAVGLGTVWQADRLNPVRIPPAALADTTAPAFAELIDAFKSAGVRLHGSILTNSYWPLANRIDALAQQHPELRTSWANLRQDLDSFPGARSEIDVAPQAATRSLRIAKPVDGLSDLSAYLQKLGRQGSDLNAFQLSSAKLPEADRLIIDRWAQARRQLNTLASNDRLLPSGKDLVQQLDTHRWEKELSTLSVQHPIKPRALATSIAQYNAFAGDVGSEVTRLFDANAPRKEALREFEHASVHIRGGVLGGLMLTSAVDALGLSSWGTSWKTAVTDSVSPLLAALVLPRFAKMGLYAGVAIIPIAHTLEKMLFEQGPKRTQS